MSYQLSWEYLLLWILCYELPLHTSSPIKMPSVSNLALFLGLQIPIIVPNVYFFLKPKRGFHGVIVLRTVSVPVFVFMQFYSQGGTSVSLHSQLVYFAHSFLRLRALSHFIMISSASQSNLSSPGCISYMSGTVKRGLVTRQIGCTNLLVKGMSSTFRVSLRPTQRHSVIQNFLVAFHSIAYCSMPCFRCTVSPYHSPRKQKKIGSDAAK